MCWAQHFTLDIPLLPLHCTPQSSGLSPSQRADWPHIYSTQPRSVRRRADVARRGPGEKYFNKLATLDLIDFNFE